MRMFIQLSDAQREEVARNGIPLPLLDRESGHLYMLLAVTLVPAPLGGGRSQIQGIPALGEGDTPEDAVFALTVALSKYLGKEYV